MVQRLEDFTPLLNTTFSLSDDGGEAREAVLVEATASGGTGESSSASFSLLFRVARDTVPPEAARQGTYRLSGDSIGPMSLFLVPVNADGDGVYFEAVFN
jgi:hypothetical protein